MREKTKKIVISSLLIAISIVLTRVFSTYLMIAGVPGARLAIGYVPIILAGIILGPYYGAMVGAIADVLGFFLAPVGVYFPLITLTSALVGILPYVIYTLTKKLKQWIRILLSVGITQIICSMFLQTLWLSMLLGKAYQIMFYPRALVTLITIPIYFILVYSIYAGLKKANLLPGPGQPK